MRERERFVCLDRNERVTPFSEAEFALMSAALGPELLCTYPDPSPLVDRLAASFDVPRAWVYPTNGSDSAIRKVFHAFLRDGDTVLLADPTYAMYPIYTEMFGAHPDLVPYGRDRRLDVGRFLERVAARPRIAALASPDQPTGAALPEAALRSIVEACHRHDVLCVIDEAYYPFHPVTAVGFVRDFDNLVVTRSFSKVGGLAGLRLGFMVAQPAILAEVERVRGAHEVNAAAIRIACVVLDHPEIGEAYVRDVEQGRAVLREAAARLGFGSPDTPANFQLLELPAPLDSSAVVNALRGCGFLVKGGFAHPSVDRCIRVTLAGPDVMRAFVEALAHVGGASRV